MNEEELKAKKIKDLEWSLNYHKEKIKEIETELKVWRKA